MDGRYAANEPSEDRHAYLAVPGVRCGGAAKDDATTTAHLFLVCDGHGGSRASQFAAERLLPEARARLLAMDVAALPDRASAGPEAAGLVAPHLEASAMMPPPLLPLTVQDAVRAALASAFAATETALLADLDATWERFVSTSTTDGTAK